MNPEQKKQKNVAIPEEYQEIMLRHQQDLRDVPDAWLRVVGMGGYNLEAGRREHEKQQLLTNHIEHRLRDVESILGILNEWEDTT